MIRQDAAAHQLNSRNVSPSASGTGLQCPDRPWNARSSLNQRRHSAASSSNSKPSDANCRLLREVTTRITLPTASQHDHDLQVMDFENSINLRWVVFGIFVRVCAIHTNGQWQP
jgi:hypothetical protein